MELKVSSLAPIPPRASAASSGTWRTTSTTTATTTATAASSPSPSTPSSRSAPPRWPSRPAATAQGGAGQASLAWETGTETDNAGFNLYRATAEDGPYAKVNDALIAAQGDPVSGASYSFTDEGLSTGTYYYKLEDVDYSGITTLHGPASATVLPRFRRPRFRPRPPWWY